MNTIVSRAIRSVEKSELAYCKFLSANDSGETGGHQAGILISKKARAMLFSDSQELSGIVKRTVKIKWMEDIETDSVFTYYQSKNELRITSFGRGFPYLIPDNTGALFVLSKYDEQNYAGYFLSYDDEIDSFLTAFGISPTETNNIISRDITLDAREEIAINEFIQSLNVEFPTSDVMSRTARDIQNAVYNHLEYMCINPDRKIIDWTDTEYKLFRALEHYRYGEMIKKGFNSVEEFIEVANQVLNRRKSRAGKSLEHHIAAIFDANRIAYEEQVRTEGNKKPDFIFPSGEAYHNANYSVDKLVSLASKTTCKDRWRQVINEADRLREKNKYLLTLQQGISAAQLKEMADEKVILVVPKPYITSYPKEQQASIWTIKKFIAYVKEVEGVV